jgi:Fe-S-cluster containining protein
MIVQLSRSYVARLGAPRVERVDQRIFWLTYFHHCLDCQFCHDSCCQYGCTVDAEQARRWLAESDLLETALEVPASSWFTEEWWDDADYPGGRCTRTQVRQTPKGPRCVFAEPVGRGCRLHALALQMGREVHDLKPMVCSLFPVLFEEGTLIVPLEIDDQTLICLGSGMTLYRSARADLEYYFGSELVAELDQLEAAALAGGTRGRGCTLPLISA